MKTYYQPFIYVNDGVMSSYLFPRNLLFENNAFTDKQDLVTFMKNSGYDEDEYMIEEFHDNDIENVILIDACGHTLNKE